MVGAVEEFLDMFFDLDFGIIRLKTTPRGGFVLEKILIKKEGGPENAYLSIEFSKNARRFFEKTKSPRKRCANFFWPSWSQNL